ncbi:hypothetical protein WME95_36210 [Sorangium sp. So ce327]|jgi:hypothetical protein|uniref:hypothetical protein n=1 Tax=Sorangium sp. So ce327 TaxID=3133301 RepID=UPI003F5D5D56
MDQSDKANLDAEVLARCVAAIEKFAEDYKEDVAIRLARAHRMQAAIGLLTNEIAEWDQNAEVDEASGNIVLADSARTRRRSDAERLDTWKKTLDDMLRDVEERKHVLRRIMELVDEAKRIRSRHVSNVNAIDAAALLEGLVDVLRRVYH